jgi:hypothetical protein
MSCLHLTGAVKSFMVLAAALLIVAFLPSAAVAAQKSPRSGGVAKIEVLNPAEGKRVAGKAVAVRVDVSTRKGFRATVAGKDVTKRFQGKGGKLRAKLRVGRDLRFGENHLLVATGRGQARRAKTAYFVVRRPARALLRVSATRTRSARTPVRVRLRVSKPVERLSLKLNDRRIRLGEPGERRSWVIALGADDGLRFGRNTVTASAERSGSGHFDRERRAIRLNRSAPLVGAGPDRSTRSGRAVVLDGGSTRAAGSRGLAYRWKIVAKPQGSRARVANSTARVARLLPDLPGTYRVRLTAGPASAATLAAERRATATASAAPASQPTCLQPPGSGPSAARSAANPLAAPLCVTPVGDPTTPPLPLESRAGAAADEVEVTAGPTEAPIGWPISTIAADGSVRVGPQTFAKQNGWARLIVLGAQSLLPETNEEKWGKGEQVISLSNASQLAEKVEATKGQIVVITGMGQSQSQAPKAAEEALAKAISAFGVEPPPSSERAEIIKSGTWSAIGSRSEPGVTTLNLYGIAQQPTPEAGVATLPGSLNGYLQNVLVDAYAFVSPEFVPIDTRAAGSSSTVSVFEVGAETVTSLTIGNGSLGLHLAAFATDAASGLPKLAASGTYVIDDPYSNTDQAGVKGAAETLQAWRESPHDLLIVMQSFGEEAVGPNTAPWGSQYWVNDGLLHPTSEGLNEWAGQPYLAIKHESELEQRLDRFWNPGYPTVAGQVGNLTGPVGHDVVANLGAGNPEVEVTKLTMVANNHPQNPAANYVRGFNGKVSGSTGVAQGRLVGTLVRNSEAGWSVRAGSAAPTSPEALWKTVYAKPTPWPLSEGAENKAAMTTIAKRLFGIRATDVREEYVNARSAPWRSIKEELNAMHYEATDAYTVKTFRALQKQLETEIGYVAAVKEGLGEWKKIFTESSFAAFVEMDELSTRIVDIAIEDAKQREHQEVEVDAEAIISEALYTAADLVGFPEAYEEIHLAEMIGVLAGGFGLAEAASPETGEDGGEADAESSAKIRATAGKLGKALAEHFEETAEALGHAENIIISDWGKLQEGSAASRELWAFSEQSEKVIRQAFSVSASQQLFEGLLPVAYQQWVVSPYFTVSNGSGPPLPGGKYACRQYTPAWKSEETKHPFASEPAGGLSTAIYRPWNAPGASASPAVPYTTPYTVRALKSLSDKLKMSRIEYAEERYALTVSHDGSSPPSSLVDPLFESVSAKERHPNFPVKLGMNKAEFFAGYGGGPADWKRVICAQE